MKAKSLHELMITKLQALYDVEAQLVKALPKMAKNAMSPDLKKAFEDHLKETQGQYERIEKIFSMLGEKPKKIKVEAIRGLVADGEWVMDNTTDDTRDAGLIAAGQYVEHYEMAGYGSLVEWAKEMGHTEEAKLLEQTLEEEKMADEKLNKLAKSKANPQANTDM